MKTLAANDKQGQLLVMDLRVFLQEMRAIIGGKGLSKKTRRETYSAKEKAAYKVGFDNGFMKCLRKFKATE